jgi:nucleoside 2-deoxyribosyltransferase
MKIYFAGADEEVIALLSEYGEVLTKDADGSIDPGYSYERSLDLIHEADVLVAEVSEPSTDLGYEIGVAETAEKRVLCLYRDTSSAMILGNRKLSVAEYESIDDIEGILRDFF